MSIGVSLLLSSDLVHRVGHPVPRLLLQQRAQSRAGTPGDLAVLLERPPVQLAELRAPHAERDLRDQHEALVGREPRRQARNLAQLQAVHDERGDLGAGVGELQPPLPRPTERQRRGERRLLRAAAAQRAATVEHAREEALLEHVGEVPAGGVPLPAARGREQLEHRLAVTVLEVLAVQSAAVGAQQGLAPGASDERHQLGRVPDTALAPEPGQVPDAPLRQQLGRGAAPGGRRVRGSNRHIGMSQPAARRPPSRFSRGLHAVDRFQQRHRRLAFAVAVARKFDDDQGTQLGALIAYYGFFSLFPLLLVFVTVLGFVLQGDPGAQESVLHSTLSQFPIIGTQLQQHVHSLHGSGVALAIGLVGATLAGLGITGATQNAFNTVWDVPRGERPNFLAWRLRGLALLATLGLLSVLSTVVAGYVTAQTGGVAEVLAGVVAALAANLLLFFTAFRVLTVNEVETRDLLPGVVTATVLWQILQHLGGYYVDHVVRHAQETSGLFAFVLGLLTWLYLGGQVTVLAAEVNVVRARGLWPRKLF
jgi:membrane protein